MPNYRNPEKGLGIRGHVYVCIFVRFQMTGPILSKNVKVIEKYVTFFKKKCFY